MLETGAQDASSLHPLTPGFLHLPHSLCYTVCSGGAGLTAEQKQHPCHYDAHDLMGQITSPFAFSHSDKICCIALASASPLEYQIVK